MFSLVQECQSQIPAQKHTSLVSTVDQQVLHILRQGCAKIQPTRLGGILVKSSKFVRAFNTSCHTSGGGGTRLAGPFLFLVLVSSFLTAKWCQWETVSFSCSVCAIHLQTAVLCQPSQSMCPVLEERWWHCVYRLHNTLHCGKVLHGAGNTEDHCSRILHRHAGQHPLFTATVITVAYLVIMVPSIQLVITLPPHIVITFPSI